MKMSLWLCKSIFVDTCYLQLLHCPSLSIVFPGVPAVHICAVFIFNICAPFSSLWLWLSVLCSWQQGTETRSMSEHLSEARLLNLFLELRGYETFSEHMSDICYFRLASSVFRTLSDKVKNMVLCTTLYYRHVCLCIIWICMLVCTICWDLFGSVVGICVLDMGIAMFVHWFSCSCQWFKAGVKKGPDGGHKCMDKRWCTDSRSKIVREGSKLCQK